MEDTTSIPSSSVLSTDGGANNSNFTIDEAVRTTITDHRGDDVRLAWLNGNRLQQTERLPPFPYQVYILSTAPSAAKNPNFAVELACTIENFGGLPCYLDHTPRYRFDVYTQPQASILACVVHQREEVRWRNTNGTGPRLVSRWTTRPNHGYQGFILVIDRDAYLAEGLVIVEFDPAEYNRPKTYRYWNVPRHGDIPIVQSRRYWDMSRLRLLLRNMYQAAGGDIVQSELDCSNHGRPSPVPDPNSGPPTLLEFWSQGIFSEAAEGPALDAELVAGGYGPLLQSTFVKDDLWVSFIDGTAPSRYRSKIYRDTADRRVMSIWDGRHSADRPDFAFALYVSNSVFWRPEALFHCLNKGLVANEPWSLDVIHGIDDIGTAHQHHTREKARRHQRSKCPKMLVRKIAGSILPTELLDVIEDLLSPPRIPSFATRPNENYGALSERYFQSIFMYFAPTEGGKSKLDVPVLIYSNPLPLENVDDSLHAFQQLFDPWGLCNATLRDNPVKVMNLRFWHRIADELHILWSLYAPRDSTILTNVGQPDVKLNIEVRKPHQPRDMEHQWRIPKWDIYISCTLHTSQPITIHGLPFFPHLAWDKCLQLVDLTDDEVLALPYLATYDGVDRPPQHSWCLTPELGFEPSISGSGWRTAEERYPLLTLEPGELTGVPRFYAHGSFPKDWEDILQTGHEYTIRLLPGMTLPRWTFGTAQKRLGPYNLPPLPLRMGAEGKFTYEGERDLHESDPLTTTRAPTADT